MTMEEYQEQIQKIVSDEERYQAFLANYSEVDPELGYGDGGVMCPITGWHSAGSDAELEVAYNIQGKEIDALLAAREEYLNQNGLTSSAR